MGMDRASAAFAVALFSLAGAAGALGLATLTENPATENPLMGGTENMALTWPMFHHDLSRTGYSESTAPGSSNLIWSFGTGSYVFSSPAVAEDGMTYVGTAPGAGGSGRLYAIDSDGMVDWSFLTGDRIYSSAAIGPDNTIYVGSDDGKLYALYDNGSLKWSYTTGSSVQSSPGVDANGNIYFGSGKDIFTLNPNGTLKWKYATGSSVVSSPAVVDGRVYVGSYDDNIYCLDAENGGLIWSFTTGDFVYSSPAVAYGKVFLGSKDYKVYCLNAGNGGLIWSFMTGARVYSSPAVAAGKVYVGSCDYKVYCLDAENGELIWNFATGGYVYSSPAIAQGKLFVGSYDSKVYCFGDIYGVSISITPEYQGGIPENTLDYTVNVMNTGGAEDTYSLTVVDNAGWNPTILPPSLTVPAGENGVATLSVTIPEDAEYCTKDNIIVTATSQGDNTVKASDSCLAHAILVKKAIYPSADIYAFDEYSRSQLKFDISSIPPGSNILSAKLWLCRFAADGWDGNVVLTRVDNQVWDETITASEFDAQALADEENYVGKFTSHGWDNLDVLNKVMVDHGAGHAYVSFRLRWANDSGSEPSVGIRDGRFLAIESQSDNLHIVFYSREYDGCDPYLWVSYVPS
jgi:outer membrane protein assembly factor BamB